MNPGNIFRQIFPTSRQLLVKRSLKALSTQGHESVLIVGAGYDPYRALFHHAKRYVRLDISPIKGKTDITADALALPFGDSIFDCVLASEVIEHVKAPVLFSSEIMRVLKPGGRVILTVPFMIHQHADPYDFWRITPEALQGLFAGFSSLEITRQGNRLHVISDLLTTAWSPYPLFLPLRIFNHLLVTALGIFSSELSTAPSGFLLVGRK